MNTTGNPSMYTILDHNLWIRRCLSLCLVGEDTRVFEFVFVFEFEFACINRYYVDHIWPLRVLNNGLHCPRKKPRIDYVSA